MSASGAAGAPASDPAGKQPPAAAGVGLDQPSGLVATVVFIGLVVAVVGSLGAPLITAVAADYQVSLAAAQWTLTIALLAGAVATPLLARLGAGPRRRTVVWAGLAVVVTGSALTVIPGPFGLLLLGRAGQGVGLGLTALMMATARDRLEPARAGSTIALLSVASTAGIGLGYPLAGWLTDLAGIRAAYGLGLVVTAAALGAAILGLPPAPARPARPTDWRGALLLTIALLGLLTMISQSEIWRAHPFAATGLLVAALALLAGWALLEIRSPAPLVDLRLLGHRPVAVANLVMLTGGIGMYLLLSLITRYVQTPPGAGYGFALSTLQAGLVLVPFSLAGFAAGKLLPPLRRRASPRTLLAGATAVVVAAFVLFATTRDQLAEPVAAMTMLGFGVGAFSAAMPVVILAATPPAETAPAMAINQVVRSVGFSIGSALGGLILAATTAPSHLLPSPGGYSVAAWTGAALTALTLLITLTLPRATNHSA